MLSLPLEAAEQSLPLQEGWNLVTVQVQPEGQASPSTLVGNLAGLKSLWKFNNETKKWLTWKAGNAAATVTENQLPGIAITSISYGEAYWVEMANNATLTLTGSIPETTPETTLFEGWNLIGIPIAGPSSNNRLTSEFPLVSVLAIKDLDYKTLLQWQNEAPFIPGYQVNQFGTSEGGSNQVNDEQFTTFSPASGYWIKVDRPEAAEGIRPPAIPVIQPSLLVTARADSNPAPAEGYPNRPEDLSISGNPTPLSASEQTHIAFFEDEEIQQISFSNEGGGILLWEAEWIAEDASESPWVTLSQQATAPGGSAVLVGETALETENIYLRLDRKNLSQGQHAGRLVLRTSAGTKEFQVTANVGGIRGEWSGFAKITSVNGKRNAIPDIDLNLSFFEDRATAGLLRGAINSRKSVLWPVDVQLAGFVTSSEGNRLQLSGGFVLPPGDQNLEPFDNFDPSSTGNDIDWNNDGFNPADRINTFGFPVSRSVSMQGELVFASPLDDEGFVLEGTYSEVIYGVMKDPVRLEGTFSIARQSPVPFDSLRTTVTRSMSSKTSPVATGPAPITRNFSTSTPRDIIVPIDAEMILQDIRVTFELSALDDSNFTISLSSPSGETLVLHDGSAVEPELFKRASYPDLIVPRSVTPTFNEFIQGTTETQGNWTFTVANDTGTPFTLRNLSLVLVGQPVVDVHGRVRDSDGNAVSGADISLLGLPYSQVFTGLTGTDGRFLIENVPAMPINLSAGRPGFTGGGSVVATQLLPSFTTNNAEEARLASRFVPFPAVPPGSLGVPGYDGAGRDASSPFEIELTLEPGPTEISAFPPYGVADLEVSFTAIRASGNITWNFGDGTNGSGPEVIHTYSNPGFYEVTMTHDEGSEQTEIVVQPSPGNTVASAKNTTGAGSIYNSAGNYSAFIFSPRFSGGGSLPASGVSPVSPQPTPQDYPATAPLADLVMIQHTYTSNADIDLAPYITSANRRFNSDSFTSGSPNYWSSSLNDQPPSGTGLVNLPPENSDLGSPAVNDPGWSFEDHNYLLWPAKWYIDEDLSGTLTPPDLDLAESVFYDQNDAEFDAPRSLEGITDPPLQLSYFRMACNFGSTISPVGISGASVRSNLSDPLSAQPLEAGPSGAGAARNLHFILTTNLLTLPSQD